MTNLNTTQQLLTELEEILTKELPDQMADLENKFAEKEAIIRELTEENEKLQGQVNNLEDKLIEREAIIHQLTQEKEELTAKNKGEDNDPELTTSKIINITNQVSFSGLKKEDLAAMLSSATDGSRSTRITAISVGGVVVINPPKGTRQLAQEQEDKETARTTQALITLPPK